MKSKKRSFVICFLLVFIHSSFAQITFQKTFGGTDYDEGRSIQQTSDGGYIIAGFTNSFGTGNYDFYLIRTDSNGWSLWAKTFGGPNDDFAYSVQQASDGGYIIAGTSSSFGAGNSDVYLLKTDTSGDTLWTKTFGGTYDDEGWSVQQTSDGGYIIAGRTQSFGAGGSDVYLLKTDAGGDTLWTKTFGGTNDDDGFAVQQTSDGGYVIAGRTKSIGAGGYDVYLLRSDSVGNLLWTKTFGGINDEDGYSIRQTSDGGYVIGGGTRSLGSGNSDVYLLRTDSAGDTLWTKTFGGADYDVGWSVLQSTDAGFVIAGYTKSLGLGDGDVYMIKTDSSGNDLWTKTYGGWNYDYGFCAQQTTDGGFIIAGGSNSSGNNDIYIQKTDAAGDTLWEKSFGRFFVDIGESVKQTIDGGYIISGSTKSFGAGQSDVYLLKIDPGGNLLWTKTFGGIGDDDGHSVQLTSDGGYIIAGSTWSFGSSQDVYLLKTDSSGNLLWSKKFGGTNGDQGYSVQQTSDGGFIIAGQFTGTVSYGDVYLLKTDSGGNLLWTKIFMGSYYAAGGEVQQTSDGGYIIEGDWYIYGGTHDICLLKTDIGGNLIWSKTFNQLGWNYGGSVHQTSDGGYIILGSTNYLSDVYLIKTDSAGNLLWSKTFGGIKNDYGKCIQPTSDGGFIITGRTQSFGAGNYDVYLLKTDTFGNLLWSKTFGGTNYDEGYSVQQTTDGGYIISGRSYSFGTGANVYLIKTDSMGNSGCYEGPAATVTTSPATVTTSLIATVSSGAITGNPGTIIGSGGIENTLCLVTGIENLITNSQSVINIFPNPANTEVILNFEKSARYNLLLCNTLGEVLFQTTTITDKIKIDVRDFPSGIYFITIRTEFKIITKKLMVSK